MTKKQQFEKTKINKTTIANVLNCLQQILICLLKLSELIKTLQNKKKESKQPTRKTNTINQSTTTIDKFYQIEYWRDFDGKTLTYH